MPDVAQSPKPSILEILENEAGKAKMKTSSTHGFFYKNDKKQCKACM